MIYCNYNLPNHLIIHEQTHHRQQEKYGLENWLDKYLNDDKFRLDMEIEAYRNQLKSIKDRNERAIVRLQCAKDLSSNLYGGVITFQEALNELK